MNRHSVVVACCISRFALELRGKNYHVSCSSFSRWRLQAPLEVLECAGKTPHASLVHNSPMNAMLRSSSSSSTSILTRQHVHQLSWYR